MERKMMVMYKKKETGKPSPLLDAYIQRQLQEEENMDQMEPAAMARAIRELMKEDANHSKKGTLH